MYRDIVCIRHINILLVHLGILTPYDIWKIEVVPRPVDKDCWESVFFEHNTFLQSLFCSLRRRPPRRPHHDQEPHQRCQIVYKNMRTRFPCQKEKKAIKSPVSSQDNCHVEYCVWHTCKCSLYGHSFEHLIESISKFKTKKKLLFVEWLRRKYKSWDCTWSNPSNHYH